MNKGSQLDRPQLTKPDSFGEAEVDVINLMTKKSFFYFKEAELWGACILQRLHTCFSPSSPGFDSQRTQKNSEEKLLVLLRLIKGTG